MRNKAIAAIETKLSTLTEFVFYGPSYAPIFESGNGLVFNTDFINRFPAICIDIRSESRERMNSGYKRLFTGKLIVATLSIGDLEKAGEDLAKYVSDEDYVLDTLLSIPSPVTSDGYHLKEFTIGRTSPGITQQSDQNDFFISELIPISFYILK